MHENINQSLYGYSSTKADKISIFKSIGNAIGSAGKAIGSAGKDVGEFLERKNKIFGTNMQAAATGAIGAVDMIGQIGAASSYNKTANDLLQDADKSEQDIGGVGYTVQNAVDQGRESAEVSAQTTASTLGLMGTGASTLAAAGSLLGPAGTFVGAATGVIGGALAGLISGGAKRREMRRQMKLAELKRINQNDFNRSGALTTVLQNNLAETEGDQTQQTLYAAEGKPFGGRKQNGWGSNGEHKIEVDGFGNILSDERLGTGIDNKDTVPIHVNPNTIILPNKKVELPGGLKISPSRYYEQTGDLQGAEYATRMNIQNKKYKNGKLPGFKWGLPEWANLGVNAFGALSSMADANSIAREEISRPNTYSSNWLQGTALNALKNLRVNAYPVIPEIYNQMGKGMYAINNAGGLSGGQRNLSRLAAMQNAYDTTSKLLQDAQDRNAKYQMAYADAAANLGNEEARRMMNAAQFDYNAYNQAHGAKRLMESQRKADAMNFLEQGVKGLTDMHMWRRMMDNYEQDSETDRAYKRWQMGLDKDGNRITKEPFSHVSPYNIMQNNGNPIYNSQDDKIAAASREALSDNVYASTQAEIQKQLAKQQKKAIKKQRIATPTTSSTTGGRILNPQAMTNAVQRGAKIGRQETPYWSPTQISDMLNYIMQNKFFLR